MRRESEDRPLSRRTPRGAAGLVLLSGGAAEARQQASPEEAQAEGAPLDIEPILPEEGLFEGETWLHLGRSLVSSAVDVLPRLVAAGIVFGIFVILALILSAALRKGLSRTRADPALVAIATRLLRVAVLLLGAIMAAAQAGVQVGSLIAGVGVAGLAVGLAAQESLSNLVAGVTILWDRPFRTGDRVTIAGQYGEVRGVGLRSTRVRTVNRLDMIIPNRAVIEDMIVNHTLNPELRLDVPIGIAYKEDTREARARLLEAVEEHPMLVADVDPEVVVVSLGDSSVDLELRVWLRDPSMERAAMCQMLELAKLTLDQAGIEIPFPQRTLHFPADRGASARPRENGGATDQSSSAS